MMANFCCLTCPRLVRSGYRDLRFPGIRRNTHTRSAVETITGTTQFMLDVFRSRERLYIRPVKVQHQFGGGREPDPRLGRGRQLPAGGRQHRLEILAGSGWPGLESSGHHRPSAAPSCAWPAPWSSGAMLDDRCRGRKPRWCSASWSSRGSGDATADPEISQARRCCSRCASRR